MKKVDFPQIWGNEAQILYRKDFSYGSFATENAFFVSPMSEYLRKAPLAFLFVYCAVPAVINGFNPKTGTREGAEKMLNTCSLNLPNWL
jgi:hypothetical protein